jgi:hypothetical protein
MKPEGGSGVRKGGRQKDKGGSEIQRKLSQDSLNSSFILHPSSFLSFGKGGRRKDESGNVFPIQPVQEKVLISSFIPHPSSFFASVPLP